MVQNAFDKDFFWENVKILAKKRYGGWDGLSARTGLSAQSLRASFCKKSMPSGYFMAAIADAFDTPAISLCRKPRDSEPSMLKAKDELIRDILGVDDPELLDLLQKILKLSSASPKVR